MRTSSKIMIHLLGGIFIASAFCYLSLPAHEKEELKEKVKDFKKKECKFLEDIA